MWRTPDRDFPPPRTSSAQRNRSVASSEHFQDDGPRRGEDTYVGEESRGHRRDERQRGMRQKQDSDRDYPQPRTSQARDSDRDNPQPRTSHTRDSDRDYPQPRTSQTRHSDRDYPRPRTSHTRDSDRDYPRPRTSQTRDSDRDYPRPRTSHTRDSDRDYPQPRTSQTRDSDRDYPQSRTSQTPDSDRDYPQPRTSQTRDSDRDYPQSRTSQTPDSDRDYPLRRTSSAQSYQSHASSEHFHDDGPRQGEDTYVGEESRGHRMDERKRGMRQTRDGDRDFPQPRSSSAQSSQRRGDETYGQESKRYRMDESQRGMRQTQDSDRDFPQRGTSSAQSLPSVDSSEHFQDYSPRRGEDTYVGEESRGYHMDERQRGMRQTPDLDEDFRQPGTSGSQRNQSVASTEHFLDNSPRRGEDTYYGEESKQYRMDERQRGMRQTPDRDFSQTGTNGAQSYQNIASREHVKDDGPRRGDETYGYNGEESKQYRMDASQRGHDQDFPQPQTSRTPSSQSIASTEPFQDYDPRRGMRQTPDRDFSQPRTSSAQSYQSHASSEHFHDDGPRQGVNTYVGEESRGYHMDERQRGMWQTPDSDQDLRQPGTSGGQRNRSVASSEHFQDAGPRRGEDTYIGQESSGYHMDERQRGMLQTPDSDFPQPGTSGAQSFQSVASSEHFQQPAASGAPSFQSVVSSEHFRQPATSSAQSFQSIVSTEHFRQPGSSGAKSFQNIALSEHFRQPGTSGAQSFQSVRGTQSFKSVASSEHFQQPGTSSAQSFQSVASSQHGYRMDESQRDINDLKVPTPLTDTDNLDEENVSQPKRMRTESTESKRDGDVSSQTLAFSPLAIDSQNHILNLLQAFPLSDEDYQDLMPRVENDKPSYVGNKLNIATTGHGKLSSGLARVPPRRGFSGLDTFRKQLPVFKHRDEILQAINNNRVVLISGETGSGKTTQVPQMILDDHCDNDKPCRMFCTQPRRIAALSIAERVAAERVEHIGQTVGYQIRLESKVSSNTLLTFCTNGVLLRTLMKGAGSFSNVTHIIMDEVHERDQINDFLLASMKDLMAKHPHLRVILMSAAFNTDLFVRFFNNCPFVQVPGLLFDVKEYFLEDVLKWTNYTNKEMEIKMEEKKSLKKQQAKLKESCDRISFFNEENKVISRRPVQSIMNADQNFSEVKEVDPRVTKTIDQLLSDIFLSGCERKCARLLDLIMSGNVSVDYQHSETKETPLMVTTARGMTSEVEQLLNMGANVHLSSPNGWTAIDWAKRYKRTEILDMMEAPMPSNDGGQSMDAAEAVNNQILTAEETERLALYQNSFDDEKVDIELILSLIHQLIINYDEGAILVFLPGFDEIIGLKGLIAASSCMSNYRYSVFTLHSSMQSSDQKMVFNTPPTGVRKIILSTNIAETSITIDDVVFVINSGKAKEKSFDALLCVGMLKSNWISKASAFQRRGRAGRVKPGHCYHMFSKAQYSCFMDFPIPEILRCRLEGLCLHTKLLAPSTCSIADYLSKCPEPPTSLQMTSAIHLLKQVDALDTCEDLTDLGHHLANLPVEPSLGKMVLYAVVLKCLDPVLTIVCTLSYRDPFVIPVLPNQKKEANAVRSTFAAESWSDHMVLLKAFQAWQTARANGSDRSFCEKNYLSHSSMEMINGTRTQLLGQLRASGFVGTRVGGNIKDLNTNSENWAVVKAALCAGSYPNLLHANKRRMTLTTQKELRVNIHMSSVIDQVPRGRKKEPKYFKSLPSEWVIYEEMTRIRNVPMAKTCTMVSAFAVAIFAGPTRVSRDTVPCGQSKISTGGEFGGEESGSDENDANEHEISTLQLDEWLSFDLDSEMANIVQQLRRKWNSLLIRRMRTPSQAWSLVDESVVQALAKLLTNEEQTWKPQQPEDSEQADQDPTEPESNVDTTPEEGSGNSLIDSIMTPLAALPSASEHPYRFYMMKVNKQHQLDLSMRLGFWSVRAVHEKKIKVHYQNGKTVYLLFTVKGSNHLQGFAKMKSQFTMTTKYPVMAGLPYSCEVEWIKRGDISFQLTSHMLNPWDNHRPLRTKHGLEVEPFLGETILRLWDRFNNVEVDDGGTSGFQPQLVTGQNAWRSSVPTTARSSNAIVTPGGVPVLTKAAAKQARVGDDHHCRFFVMKPRKQDQLDRSMEMGLWSTHAHSDKTVNKNYNVHLQNGKTVYLIFSLRGSHAFQGFGKMTSEFTKNMNDPISKGLHYTCNLQWMRRGDIPFPQTKHLLNPWNKNTPVGNSEDGKEIEPSVGENVLRLWDD